MNTSEYVELVKNTVINQVRVKNINEIYDTQVNTLIAKIISLADTVDFFDVERRALSYVEICKPREIMEIDFISRRQIPLIDVYDNTYIVFSIDDKQYSLYNATDDLSFKNSDTFEELLR